MLYEVITSYTFFDEDNIPVDSLFSVDIPSLHDYRALDSIFSDDYSIFAYRVEKRYNKNLTDAQFIDQLKDDYNLNDYDLQLISGQKGLLKKRSLMSSDILPKRLLLLGANLSSGYVFLSMTRADRSSLKFCLRSNLLGPWANGMVARLMAEWDKRGRGECSNTTWSTYDSSHASKYTSASFIANYLV